jgi:dipeptide/tripeptide permease
MKYLGIAAGIFFLIFVVMLMRSSHEGWSRMGVIITLAVFNVAFWAGFEQAGGTMNLFAKDNTDRVLPAIWAPGFLKSIEIKYLGILAGIMLVLKLIQIYIDIYSDDEAKKQKLAPVGKIGLYGTLFFGFLAVWNYLSTGPEIPASWFQNINPFAILVFAPLFSVMWLKLDALGLNPRTPVKFALGLFLGALAFFIMTIAYNKAQTGVLVSPLWLVVVYVVLTLGELMLSPIGLSMITKLADAKIVSIVMGLWMASFAAGNYIAGMLESILEGLRDKGINLELYPFLTYVMIIVGLLLLVLSPLINRAMKGIH